MRFEIINYFENLNYTVYHFWGHDDNLDNLKKIKFDFNQDKKYIVFFHNDYNGHIDLPNNVVIFRASLLKSQKKINEFIFPVSWVHVNREYGVLQNSKKKNKPQIGFCGSITTYSKRLEWLEILKKSDLIYCDFVYRNGFCAGSFEDLLKNLEKNEFCFCPRGNGNFSLRFYECLCAGRIPVVIDTDIILPFENEINWNEIIVIDKDINKLPMKILDFWNNNNIEQIQNKCKYIYEKYFKSTLILELYKKQVDNYFFPN